MLEQSTIVSIIFQVIREQTIAIFRKVFPLFYKKILMLVDYFPKFDSDEFDQECNLVIEDEFEDESSEINAKIQRMSINSSVRVNESLV